MGIRNVARSQPGQVVTSNVNVTVHALLRACTVTLRKPHPDKAKLCLRCARDFRRSARVLRKKRAKHPAFQAGLSHHPAYALRK